MGGPDSPAQVKARLRAHAQASQRGLLAHIAALRAGGLAGVPTALWITNAVSLSAAPQAVAQLAARVDVANIRLDADPVNPILPSALPAAPAAANIALVNAPALWQMGWYGQGVTVALLDSGVSALHPDLAAQYRGGAGAWFDPYNQHPTPYDPTGHGTQVLGVILGRDASGSSLGMAPQARWIAAKIYPDVGLPTETAIHLSFQWVLDPDGNPATPDAPQVVNNSWGNLVPGCVLSFEPDLAALRAAGIVPVFAAGNSGPQPATDTSPANNPSALAVGAVDNTGLIWTGSSRGPNTCDALLPFPHLSAPGVGISTTDLFGLYTSATGTSLSAPHAAGALALLISAYPGLGQADQQQALIDGALDLGAPGLDALYGYGRLDALAAYQSLAARLGPARHVYRLPLILNFRIQMMYLPLVSK